MTQWSGRWTKGITSGTGANTFSPNASCTRGQMVTFLWRALKLPAPRVRRNPFTDVNRATTSMTRPVGCGAGDHLRHQRHHVHLTPL